MRVARRPRAQPAPLAMLGVDASLSSTGLAYREHGTLVTRHIDTGLLRGPHRLFYIRNRVDDVLVATGARLVILEDYAMGRHGNVRSQFGQAELVGILKTLFWERGIDIVLVPPTSLKMVITGKGNAKKPQMRAALAATFGYDISQEDEADAAGLLLLGELRHGLPVVAPTIRAGLRLHTLADLEQIAGRLQSIALRVLAK